MLRTSGTCDMQLNGLQTASVWRAHAGAPLVQHCKLAKASKHAHLQHRWRHLPAH